MQLFHVYYIYFFLFKFDVFHVYALKNIECFTLGKELHPDAVTLSFTRHLLFVLNVLYRDF